MKFSRRESSLVRNCITRRKSACGRRSSTSMRGVRANWAPDILGRAYGNRGGPYGQ